MDTTLPRQCVVAGVSNNVRVILDRTLAPFTVSGDMADVLSPEYGMRSRMEVSFSTPIFVDIGDLYSQEYIDNRTAQKEKILSRITISPNIPLTVDDIVLTPTKMSLIADFQENTRYRISLSNIEDIYGRQAAMKLDFIPEKKPFLSIALDGGRTMFAHGQPISAKVFSLIPQKDTYTLKLCKI
jgi:hypothetical protein